MNTSVFRKLLHRKLDANKYDFGHVLVIGGSPGMVGAPLLAAQAALRTGAGLVTVASTPHVIDKLERRIKEIMTLSHPIAEITALDHLKRFIARRHVSVIVIGPGLPASSAALARHLARQVHLPIVIDAGALSAFEGHLDQLDKAAEHNKMIILTPHTGEYQRLSREPVAEFASKHKVTVVLKGHPTDIVHPNGKVHENTTGNPGLATAGTGDVLCGVIAGVLAQQPDGKSAVESAVYLHGLAGDMAAEAKTQPGMIASDVIEYLPAALKKLSK